MEINRAIQFSSFDALKGLNELMKAERDRMKVEKKRDLSEEQLQGLDWKIRNITSKKWIRVSFYEGMIYITIESEAFSVDFQHQQIHIGERDIDFNDIIEIESDW